VKIWVGVTDNDWFELLSKTPDLDEVNFWQPGGNRLFRVLEPNEPFLFKLHSPRNYVVGGGYFSHSTLIPLNLAWESFRFKNGAESLVQMRERVGRYRRGRGDLGADYTIGCILLWAPFFLPRDLWIPVPAGWSPNIVQGKGYDAETEPGASLLRRVEDAQRMAGLVPWAEVVREEEDHRDRYGAPILVRPRLGQGSFRVVVTDAYERRCAITNERVLPTLEAAHIRPYAESGPHRVENGILLRSDLHRLLDAGYMTIASDLRLEVSRRIRDEFHNGREYYALHGRDLRLPRAPYDRPSERFLRWHQENVFRG
jgi:putative restriction endonuclease